jgi:hypothetical protein
MRVLQSWGRPNLSGRGKKARYGARTTFTTVALKAGLAQWRIAHWKSKEIT